mgnify:CR=1 FL=1
MSVSPSPLTFSLKVRVRTCKRGGRLAIVGEEKWRNEPAGRGRQAAHQQPNAGPSLGKPRHKVGRSQQGGRPQKVGRHQKVRPAGTRCGRKPFMRSPVFAIGRTQVSAFICQPCVSRSCVSLTSPLFMSAQPLSTAPSPWSTVFGQRLEGQGSRAKVKAKPPPRSVSGSWFSLVRSDLPAPKPPPTDPPWTWPTWCLGRWPPT